MNVCRCLLRPCPVFAAAKKGNALVGSREGLLRGCHCGLACTLGPAHFQSLSTHTHTHTHTHIHTHTHTHTHTHNIHKHTRLLARSSERRIIGLEESEAFPNVERNHRTLRVTACEKQARRGWDRHGSARVGTGRKAAKARG